MSGLVGIGVLSLVLVQNLEITVEPGNVSEDNSSLAESSEPNGDLNPLEIDSADPSRSESSISDDAPTTDATPDDSEIGSSAEATQGIAPAERIGGLRVSNQTTHPLRVALLPQESHESVGQLNAYSEPVHWDFSPGEGSSQGLVLAVPDKSLALRPGDVLTAFAQDGSQRYWGPFVVGSTPFPQWNDEEGEWTLMLRDDF